MNRTCCICGREISDDEYNGYDDLSKREFALSGMCLDPCQNEVFACNADCGCWDDDDEDGWEEND